MLSLFTVSYVVVGFIEILLTIAAVFSGRSL